MTTIVLVWVYFVRSSLLWRGLGKGLNPTVVWGHFYGRVVLYRHV